MPLVLVHLEPEFYGAGGIMEKSDSEDYGELLTGFYQEMSVRSAYQQGSDLDSRQWDRVLAAVKRLPVPMKEAAFIRAALATEQSSFRKAA
jgi:hypothetical protein